MPSSLRSSIVVAIVGSGGDGASVLGDLLLSLAARQGLYGVMVQSYGPQIRGGESAAVVRISRDEVAYEGDETDVLLCFRVLDLSRFAGVIHLHSESLVLLDANDGGAIPASFGCPRLPPIRYPFARLENGVEVAGEPKNVHGLALLCRILGWPEALAREAMTHRLGGRPERLARNVAAFDTAWASPVPASLPMPPGHATELRIETGNEAVARGAISAGLRFFAGYPITPSSEILETLLDELPEAGGRVVQAEDEMAALGMVIGASFGGVTSMTATSGPGLSLMTELLGLAAISEIPVVVVDCQRAGPSTGMPSKTEQSDLDHAIHGGHGDFPRAVMGVLDVAHAREATWKAVHLAESFQIPVLLLSDAYIAQRREILGPAPAPARPPARTVWQQGDQPARFHLLAEDGVSPFRVPGTPDGMYLASGIEHGEQGTPSSDGGTHQRMSERRFSKLDAIAKETRGWFRTLGADGASHGVIAWGSTWGVLGEWIAAHPDFRAFVPEMIHPFPLQALSEWRRGLDSLAVLELSHQGQLFRYLSGQTDLSRARSLARSGGIPFRLDELDRLLSPRVEVLV